MNKTMTDDRRRPLREEGAEHVLSSVDDAVTKNLMTMGLGIARMRYVRWNEMTDAELEARLPAAPFDMEFFAYVLRDLFSDREVLERVLAGESIASATGWDI